MNKVKTISDVFDYLEREGKLKDGTSIMLGGFYTFGRAETLMFEVFNKGFKNLSVITNDTSTPAFPDENIEAGSVDTLLLNGRISELTISYKGPFKAVNDYVEKSVKEGKLKVNYVPQGTLIKRIRSAGEGVYGFYTNVGVGTEIGKGKKKKVIDGIEVILEKPLKASVGFVKAYISDRFGNLVYRATERNLNPMIATACDYVVAEADIIREEPIGPHLVHTPGNYINAIVQSSIEPKGRFRPESNIDKKTERIAKRAALELKDGYVVNLGVGIPTAVANYLPKDIRVFLQSENGILGMGRAAKKGEEIGGVIDAGRNYVLLEPFASFFDSAASFGMINGGHVDVAILGALEVDQHGSLANWKIPGKMTPGVGGGMDLATNARKLIIVTEHQRNEKSKIKKKCSLPLTAYKKVDTIITDMAVMKVVKEGLLLKEIAEDCSIEDVVKATDAELIVKDVKKMG